MEPKLLKFLIFFFLNTECLISALGKCSNNVFTKIVKLGKLA